MKGLGLSLLVCALTVSPLDAGPPTISSISPRSAQGGQEVTLVVEGTHLSADAELISRRLSLVSTPVESFETTPDRIAFRFRLNSEELPGWHGLRVRTREGISNPVLFVVGVLPEAEEVEPNGSPAEAMAISGPITVKGRLGAADRDTFRFTARKGERLVFEVEARRLGSAVDPTLLLFRPDGRELELSEDAYGLDVDARIDHTFESAGEYLIQVHDTVYLERSPDFYRLRVGSFPYAEAVFPIGGKAGSEVRFSFEGGNLDGAVTTRLRLDPDPLERWMYVSLPPSLDTGGAPFKVTVGSHPDTFEEPRKEPGALQPLIPFTTLNGRIETAGELDRYELPALKGETATLDFEDLALRGKAEFEVDGAHWHGGVVKTWSTPGLHASGKYAYEAPNTGGGEVIFASPVDAVTFFYVNRPRDNGAGSDEGTASALNSEGTLIASVDSLLATEPGSKFVTLDPVALISRIKFTTGVIDDFSCTKVPKKDQAWLLEVEAAALGSQLDPVLAVYGQDGKRLLLADDDGSSRDPRAVFSPPSAERKMQTSILTVEDLHRRGGKAYGYRLSVTTPRPDFSLVLRTTQLNLPLDGTALLEVECVRRDYAGAVQLSVSPVPGGFRVGGGEILAGQKSGCLTLTGPASGELRFVELVVTGTGNAKGESIVRRAQGTAYLAVDDRIPVSPLPVAVIAAAVTKPVPFGLHASKDRVDVVVGHSARVPVEVVRGEGLSGEVTLASKNLPPGVTAARGMIAADQGHGELTITAAPEAGVCEGDCVVEGTLTVNELSLAAPSPAFRVRVVQPLAVELAENTLTAAAGSRTTLRGKVLRVSPFAGKVAVVAKGLPTGVTAPAVEVAPEASDFELELMVPAEAKAGTASLSLILSTPLGTPEKLVAYAHPAIPVTLVITAE